MPQTLSNRYISLTFTSSGVLVKDLITNEKI